MTLQAHPSAANAVYPIGTPGQAWRKADITQWRTKQTVQRSYQGDVLAPLFSLLHEPALSRCASLQQFGVLDYRSDGLGTYPLYAVRSMAWDDSKPFFLITGGVHGYETSGVHGALLFLREQFVRYASRANLLVLPCISPWGYETINRWNPHAVDPNRAFIRPHSPAQEAALPMALLDTFPTPDVHIDLHETTDTDASEFRPAKAARDGLLDSPCTIPDGFYLVGDRDKPQLAFQRAIIDAVRRITHIAQVDAQGLLLDQTPMAEGVILYPKKGLGLCGAMTQAPFVTTTEVYPDSPRSTPALCQRAQVAAVCAGFDFGLGKP
jgi:Protein of unknown function (DUF2817)